jgi:hypothetical protein
MVVQLFVSTHSVCWFFAPSVRSVLFSPTVHPSGATTWNRRQRIHSTHITLTALTTHITHITHITHTARKVPCAASKNLTLLAKYASLASRLLLYVVSFTAFAASTIATATTADFFIFTGKH